MLLRRPWIHHCAVPSTVHHNVKCVSGGKIITVKNECQVPLCSELDVPFIGEPARDPHTAQNIEIVDMIHKGMDKTDFLN